MKESVNASRREFFKTGMRMFLLSGLTVAGFLGWKGKNELAEEHCVYLNKCGGCRIASACDLPQKKTSKG
jgi:hypothetical protein